MIRAGLGISTGIGSEIPIEIISTGIWTMNAVVADSYTNQYQNIFLVGDAAHSFPPAGGFGMNTGLQDVHNLAWKLAHVLRGDAKPSLLASYETERRKIALENTSLSLRNYQKTIKAAKMLGLDADLAQVTITAAKYLPSSKLAFDLALKLGMQPLKLLARLGSWYGDQLVKSLRSYVEVRTESLPLLFPAEDIGFTYQNGVKATYAPTSVDLGRRLPHAWLEILAEGKQEIISTLDLPQYFSSSSSYPGPPRILVLASDAQVDRWINHLLLAKSNLFCFVAMAQCESQHRRSHQQLQEELQHPRYLASQPDRKAPMQTMLAYRGERSLQQRIRKIRAVDVCDRWWKDIAADQTIILRPDGHVAIIYPNDAATLDTQILETHRYFHLSPST
jgi:hypothetical protein